MKETSEELPNLTIGIDLLGPDLTSNKNKAEQNSSCTFHKLVGGVNIILNDQNPW